MPDFRELWSIAMPFDRFVAESEHHRGLWEGIYKLMRVPEWAFQAVPPGTRRRLLVIAEDWCGDASSTIPIVARFADTVPGMELRILRRDEHPEPRTRRAFGELLFDGGEQRCGCRARNRLGMGRGQ